MRISARIALCLILGFSAVLAQQGPSPLIGKIIHVYNPRPGDTINVDMSGTGYPMTPVAGTNWLTFTVPSTIQNHINKFGVRNNYGQNSFWIGRTGLATGGADAFTEADFAGGNELWIVIDPVDPNSAPAILTSAPKVVNVFNPWQLTAPAMVLSGGVRKGMLTVPGNCGWFWAFLLKPAEQTFHLEEVNRTDTYGQGGVGTSTAFNMTAEFAAKGVSTLWLDTDINSWLTTDPKKNRPCGYQMAAVVRDFSISHPDFDFDGLQGDQSAVGMVQDNIGPNRKPVRTSKTSPLFNKFEEWFNTVPGSNAETCVDLPMTKSDDGMWLYDSFDDATHGFWPIDNFTNPHNEKTKPSCYVRPIDNQWITNQPAHNMNYCMESHATFVYQKGQKFEFRGDDDVWVYIDGKLAIDLGGIHTPKADTIDLDKLNLTAGKTYNWDFFYCERQPCGSSLRIKTSIFFRQQRALEAEEDPANPGTFNIIKRVGGTGACGSIGDSVQIVPVTNLIYKLWNAGGTELESLGDGSWHKGGIVIATPKVVVDTSKIDDLPPGNYRVVAYEAASQSVRAEVPFVITNRSWVQFEPGQNATVPVGTLVPVIAANRVGDAAPTGAAAYTFTVNPASGLQIYADANKTVPVTTLAGATGADGLDTLWVTGDPNALTNLSFTLVTRNSTRSVTVTFTLPPLFVPKVLSATVHDDNADGIGDRIVATYDSSIAGRFPDRITYQWPAAGAVGRVDSAALDGKVAGSVITLTGLALTTDRITSGQGTFTSVYKARGGRDTTQSIALQDRIAPILIKATMIPGTTQDTLRLVFSEPVAAGAAASVDLFVYRLNLDGADVQYAPAAFSLNADKTGADLLFPTGAPEAPRPGNFVRIMDGPGRIADALGNAPGDNSPFLLIGGHGKPEIKTVTLHTIDPTKLQPGAPTFVVSVQPKDADVQAVVKETGRLGHLITVDLGEHAQSDGLRPNVNPENVSLTYEVAYFTNLGVPVASEKRTITCKDPLFGSNDCRSNRRYLFVGWDFTTNTVKKQRVATGAYIVRLKYKVTGGVEPLQGGLDQTWGVIRGH